VNLLTCIVTRDRLELTRRCIESYLETTEVPHHMVVVDTGSDAETRSYLSELCEDGYIDDLKFAGAGYPGPACNQGWESGLRVFEEATFLHRSDNDVEYLPGWCDEVERCFEREEVGQVGLMLAKYEQGCGNVGGNQVLARKVWDAGVRWYEQPWAPGVQEDGHMSESVIHGGLEIVRVEQECVIHHGWDFDDYPDYYTRSAIERGLSPEYLREIFEEMKSR